MILERCCTKADGDNVSELKPISYNTEEDCSGAEQYDEERWNYAFWRQDESVIINPDYPDSLISQLFEWYKENNIQNIGYQDCDNCYDADCNYIGKGPVGHYELISLISDIAKQLQEEGFIKDDRFFSLLSVKIVNQEH